MSLWTSEMPSSSPSSTRGIRMHVATTEASPCSLLKEKILSRILLNWLSSITEELPPELQYGFCPNQGTIDMISLVHQLQEKPHEHWIPINFIFWDLEKLFDSIWGETLWKIFAKYGIPSRFIAIIHMLHNNTSGEVVY